MRFFVRPGDTKIGIITADDLGPRTHCRGVGFGQNCGLCVPCVWPKKTLEGYVEAKEMPHWAASIDLKEAERRLGLLQNVLQG